MMTLKLAGLQDDTPVKLTVELPAEVHRDLIRYGAVLSDVEGRPFTPAQLIGPMLSRFMATDRTFTNAKAGRP
ncbi:DUF2274 domain-containing protein [Brevundimonas goettingensis]|uniref:DUF2274 domain-containing protein n=2 Tax=Brevundimonas goettingensis TaxID=2774190 RepID=A0A975C5N8_9CAUL|nr:DUF2274 domain-containing protein [Brevundimonas goettingensis]QTC93347.1 DUF2274 domain-containing protein [Brevundimonas goettingensis]